MRGLRFIAGRLTASAASGGLVANALNSEVEVGGCEMESTDLVLAGRRE